MNPPENPNPRPDDQSTAGAQPTTKPPLDPVIGAFFSNKIGYMPFLISLVGTTYGVEVGLEKLQAGQLEEAKLAFKNVQVAAFDVFIKTAKAHHLTKDQASQAYDTLLELLFNNAPSTNPTPLAT